MIHKITSLPILSKEKSTKTQGRHERQKKTLAEWEGRGLKISTISDMELRFKIHVISLLSSILTS